MRPILVAIDFSECSINALEHGISIANRAELDIRMIWVRKPEGTHAPFIEASDDPLAAVEVEFKRIIEKYQPDLPNSKMEFKIREGKVHQEIASEARETSAFLIILGTHGISGFEEFWIGSNAQKIVSEAPCPIITIRGGISVKRELTKIVLPLDNTMETRQKVPFTTLLAKIFGAEVHILLLYTTRVQAVRLQIEEYTEQVAKYLHENKVKFVAESIEVTDLVEDILEYAQKVDANLISIMAEMVKSTKNIWLGSYAHQLVNHSTIPVLTIHNKEIMRVAPGG